MMTLKDERGHQLSFFEPHTADQRKTENESKNKKIIFKFKPNCFAGSQKFIEPHSFPALYMIQTKRFSS